MPPVDVEEDGRAEAADGRCGGDDQFGEREGVRGISTAERSGIELP